MPVFDTANRTHSFTRNPKVARGIQKGWVIVAYCDDETMYGGSYTRAVGFASFNPGGSGYIAFRLKRDAKAAMAEAIADGILKVVA